VPEPELPEPEPLPEPAEPEPLPEGPTEPLVPPPAPMPGELLRVLLELLVSGVLVPAPEVPVPDMRPLLQPATRTAVRPRLSKAAGRIVDLKVMCVTS
jgi:hypothetical protein